VTDLIAAEWLKLRTTRILLGIIPAALAISLASLAGVVLAEDNAAALEGPDGIRRAFSVTGAGAILVLVLGIIISSGEYRHGTAADTFLTTPRRQIVLAAKLVVGAAVGLATGVLVAGGGVGLAALLYRTKSASFPVGDTEVWLTLAGVLIYTSLFAMVGVAFGSMIRNQTLAIASALAWFGVIEHVLINLLPALARWFPFAAGEAIVRAPVDDLLSPLAGVVVLAVYGAAIAVAGMRVAATRDA
jgi:ABC-2 type transport system permease protein